MFQYSSQELNHLAEQVLNQAQTSGATAAEVDISEFHGQAVSVRLQNLENIEHQQDQSLDITVYVDQRKGRAATSDFSAQSIEQTIHAAMNIAKYTAEDAYSGLADANLMATEFLDLDLYHEYVLSVEKATELALEAEASALSFDKRISNSEGAGIQTGHGQYIYANTHGFFGYEKTSRHSLSCSILVQDQDHMYRDFYYDVARDANDLSESHEIGEKAAQRAIGKIGSRKIQTGEYPVVFDTRIASSLISHLISALSGGALYRKSSFLYDSLGKKIFTDSVNIEEDPFILKGLASSNFDAEGVATRKRNIVEEGVISAYFLSHYSASKLGMQTTANAGGAHNIIAHATHPDQESLLKTMGTGLLVTELMGQGVNLLTGDYSRGAAGFWVEKGIIMHPVEEITIASNLQEMFAHIIAIGADREKHKSYQVGSILIEQMTIAAAQ